VPYILAPTFCKWLPKASLDGFGTNLSDNFLDTEHPVVNVSRAIDTATANLVGFNIAFEESILRQVTITLKFWSGKKALNRFSPKNSFIIVDIIRY
jgi:hypothetical protein